MASLLDEIEALRQKHYSFADISELLASKTALSFKPNTLRKYFFEERTKRQAQGLFIQTDPANQPLGRKRASNKPARNDGSSKATPAKRLASDNPEPMPLNATPGDEGPSITATLDPQPEAQPSQYPQKNWPSKDWDDSNPPAGGLLKEPRFNVIERD
ncbi:MAG: hypothetical protein HC824_21815 [Synechococcales cyanobacterium RM1_1_8]|nr:hypothetical protein [Synechococcales cyanobacterium RM1_1_8]